MKETELSHNSIDEYILQFPLHVQKILKELRIVIKESAPEAEEKISYGMPTFVLCGNLVHFAAHKKLIGFYPTPNGMDAFKHELSGYKCSKGAVQFPLEAPLPFDLISQIVKFRVAENKNKAEEKMNKKK